MKFLIITYDEYFNIPYIENYEREIERQGHSFDVVLWNRSNLEIEKRSNHFVFSAPDCSGKVGKIGLFLQWRNFVLRVLKTHKYDRLIILTTIPGVLLFDKLIWNYRTQYWFDVRDYTYEYIPVFKKIVGSIVNHSLVTSISSEAFRTFLPQFNNLVLIHNISNETMEVDKCTLDVNKKPITIGFVGGIQYAEQNQKLLKQFRNHPKYQMKYVGKPHLGCDLQSFCTEKQIENVQFLPAYKNAEKPEIYRTIDMINCVYGGGTEIVRLALPNKLYDCILFKKPMMVSKGTYLAKIVEQYHLGLAVDVETNDVAQIVDTYLENFDSDAFLAGCNAFLKKVKSESIVFKHVLERFCAGEEIS